MTARAWWIVVSVFVAAGLSAGTAKAGVAAPPDPEKVVIADRTSGWSATVGKARKGASKEGEITWRHGARGAAEREWTTEITNTSNRLRCMAVEYHFVVPGQDLEPLFAGVHPEPEFPADGEIAYAYVRETNDWIRLSVPFAEVVSPADDRGVSFAPDLADMPILPFEVRMKKLPEGVRIVIRRPQIRLEPNGSAKVKLFAASHGGDKREGLGWMCDKWSDLFTARDGLEKYQYGIWTGGMISDEGIEKGVAEAHIRQGVWQIRPRSWFGMSCSDHEPWLTSMDQKWYHMKEMTDLPGHPGKDAKFDAIIEFLKNVDPEEASKRVRAKTPVSWAYTWQWFTHEDIRAYNKKVKELGFHMLYYWNPSETWSRWAEKFYPESLYVPFSTDFWTDSTVLDPFPGSARATDLVAEAKRIFDEYPDCAGLFMDQVYYDLENHKEGFDDGISISKDAKPFSRHQWNTYYVIKEIRKLADESGRVLQPNFIFNSLEIASLTDFGLVEGIGPMQSTSFFYDIGNRLHICQSHNERIDQEAALMGWQSGLWINPKLPTDDRTGRFWLSKLMRPIMMLFQGRTLVLEPYCLDLPDGFEGSVFRQPDGNTVVTVVSPGVSYLSPYSFSNVPLVVRVKDASKIKRVYQLSSDRLGPVLAPFRVRKGELDVILARHRSISALVLARTGKFLALKEEAVLDAAGSVELVRDNLDADSRETFTAQVKPGLEGFATFQIDQGGELSLPRADIEPDGKPVFEVRVVPEIEVTIAPPPLSVKRPHFKEARLTNEGAVTLPVGAKARFVATVRNHTDAARDVAVTVSGMGVSAAPAKEALRLEAGRVASVPINVTAQDVGPAALTVDAGGSATIHFEITGTTLAGVDLATTKSATLIVDSIATGGLSQKILLNGVEAGKLVQRIGTPVWDFGARHELSKDGVAALAADNVIEIETGDKKFAVKNLKLEVVLPGRRCVVAADPLPQSTPADWLQACGKRVPPGSKMRWTLTSAEAAGRARKPRS